MYTTVAYLMVNRQFYMPDNLPFTCHFLQMSKMVIELLEHFYEDEQQGRGVSVLLSSKKWKL